MDFKQIQELIRLVNESNIGEVSLEQKDFKITIKQKEEPVTQMIAGPAMQQPMYAQQLPQPQQQALPQPAPAAAPAASNTIAIKSPMIGTFYRRPSPDKRGSGRPGIGRQSGMYH
jgi:acetyl-CoA carboxylase biotin carboxyl carrier protein